MMRLSALTLSLFFISWLSSCTKQDLPQASETNDVMSQRPDDPGFAENEMVMYWNQKATTVVTGPITPPAQHRYLAMIHIAMHDALNAIKPKYETYALNNHRVQFANPDAAIASAAYHTIVALNLPTSNPILTWYNESLATIPDGESKELGKTLGQASANAIIANRAADNFSIANQQLPQPDGDEPGEYVSTLPFSNPGMPKIKALHQWGTQMKAFVLQTNSQFRPAPPYPINSLNYVSDYNEVKLKGGRVNHNRTEDETEIGKFWVERSALGWNRFTRNILETKKLDAWRTARLFALVNTAMADASTASFEAKYFYFYWRPESAIRLGESDGNPLTTGDATWLPSNMETPPAGIYTPPLPEYPSLHAGYGGAAGTILLRFFESDIVNVSQTSTSLPGVVRNYTSIKKAMRDNCMSRVYVGYHFRRGVMEGEKQGVNLGHYIFENSFKEK